MKELNALKAEAKVGILDETFMNLRNVEVALFAADAAASCSSARLLSGDDPHGCSAAVKYAMKQVSAVRNAMHLEKRKYKINRGRNKKSKMKMQEHSKWLNTKIQNLNESVLNGCRCGFLFKPVSLPLFLSSFILKHPNKSFF